MTKKQICIIIFLFTFNGYGYCFDDEVTHPNLTTSAVNKSNLGTYLKDYLLFNDGIDTEIPSNSKKTIRSLLEAGSTEEDSPDCRAASHFLNPLKPWDEAAVSDTSDTFFGATVIDPGCFVLAPFSDRYSIHKYSDVTWATGYTSPPSSTSMPSDTGNDMDWNAARTYYKLALIEPDKSKREKYFAKAFQALGQVMHLVQDMAVPAHVRNDFTV